VIHVSTQVAGIGRLEMRRIDMERLPFAKPWPIPNEGRRRNSFQTRPPSVDTNP
jgi:hypothetical protein